MSTPHPFDERLVERAAKACDAIDDEQPRQPGWKVRKDAAYAALAHACNRAAANAKEQRP